MPEIELLLSVLGGFVKFLTPVVKTVRCLRVRIKRISNHFHSVVITGNSHCNHYIVPAQYYRQYLRSYLFIDPSLSRSVTIPQPTTVGYYRTPSTKVEKVLDSVVNGVKSELVTPNSLRERSIFVKRQLFQTVTNVKCKKVHFQQA